jgi:general secretion pathway protein E
MSRFPIEYCRQHQLLVVEQNGAALGLITQETSDIVVDCVGRSLGQPLPTHCIEQADLRDWTNRFYEAQATEAVHEEAAPSLEDVLTLDSSADDLLESDARGPVVQMVNRMLLDAIQQRASDVHLQPYEDRMTVRMRVDGVLSDVKYLPKSIQEEVISRLKVAGQMNIAEKRLPQDGRATVSVGDRVIDLRLASMPTSHGERVVVRLLDKSARLYRLAEIGMEGDTLDRFRSVIHIEHGLILVTGPTGSGKSTTLYAALQELDTTQRNAVTLEDPIEYQLDGISQTQINTKKGMTFASGMRSVLRQDPDIIMVGEIRDHETAVMAVQAALTGHLVFSTLHTNDAASAVTRLLDLGIEPYLVSSSVLGVMAQRLVRRVCRECHGEPKSPASGSAAPQAPASGLTEPQNASPANETPRCTNCRGTGYRGREGIYELMLVDDRVRDLIQQRAHASAIRDAGVAAGMRLLRESGMSKVDQGITTREEIDRVTMRTAL